MFYTQKHLIIVFRRYCGEVALSQKKILICPKYHPHKNPNSLHTHTRNCSVNIFFLNKAKIHLPSLLAALSRADTEGDSVESNKTTTQKCIWVCSFHAPRSRNRWASQNNNTRARRSSLRRVSVRFCAHVTPNIPLNFPLPVLSHVRAHDALPKLKRFPCAFVCARVDPTTTPVQLSRRFVWTSRDRFSHAKASSLQSGRRESRESPRCVSRDLRPSNCATQNLRHQSAMPAAYNMTTTNGRLLIAIVGCLMVVVGQHPVTGKRIHLQHRIHILVRFPYVRPSDCQPA